MVTNKLNDNILRKAYRDMLLLRSFEERAAQLYGMGLIKGFCHLYIGQEAVAVGLCAALSSSEDKFITSYRAHGMMLAIGSDPGDIMAELLGKDTGCSNGKGGSMHMFDEKRNFYGGQGIVGTPAALGTGMGFALKYSKSLGISITMFGDGAVNQGQVYESFNLAKLWNLPVLYIIENNEYGMGTSVQRASATTELYKRGEVFNIPGACVDGMDFVAVYNAVIKAAEYVRSGNGPTILEMKTYRYRGHSMSDPATYRTKEEVESYKESRDPIKRLKEYISTNKIMRHEAEFIAIRKEVQGIIQDAVNYAQNSKEPPEEELYNDVLCC